MGGKAALERVQRVAAIGWVVGLGTFVVVDGIPSSVDVIMIWLFLALVVACITDLRRSGPSLLRDWIGLAGMLVVYSLLRGVAAHTPWSPHHLPQLDADRVIGAGVPLTLRLQGWLLSAQHLHPWDYAVLVVYLSHFFVSFVVMAVLWRRDHRRFQRYAAAFLVLSFCGFATFVLFPSQPPWMVSQLGGMGHVVRVIPLVFEHAHLHFGAALFLKGSLYDNQVAALPSLHAAYPMLLCAVFWRDAPRRTRVLLLVYPLIMGFAVVYSGEHFVIDVLAGWLYALAVWKVVDTVDALIRSRPRAGVVEERELLQRPAST